MQYIGLNKPLDKALASKKPEKGDKVHPGVSAKRPNAKLPPLESKKDYFWLNSQYLIRHSLKK